MKRNKTKSRQARLAGYCREEAKRYASINRGCLAVIYREIANILEENSKENAQARLAKFAAEEPWVEVHVVNTMKAL